MPRPRGTGERTPLDEALSRVGDRWTLAVVAALGGGPARFSDLQQGLTGIAPNVLAQRLRDMERDGLVVARPYSERPPRAAYELSASGRDLLGAVSALAAWGSRHAPGAEAPRHAACGTPLEVRWWCPACGEPAEADDDAGDRL